MKKRTAILITVWITVLGVILIIASFFYINHRLSQPIHIHHQVKEVTLPSPALPHSEAVVNVLALSGGGIRGVIPLYVLQYLEEQTGQPIAKLFDVIVGTSVGSINATALTLPGKKQGSKYQAKDVIALFDKYGPQIFEIDWTRKIFTVQGKFSPAFSSHQIYQILKQFFGETTLFELNDRVVIPAYDLKSHKPILFYSWGKNGNSPNFYLSELVTGAVATPGILPPVLISSVNYAEQFLLLDGALFMNDPSLEAYFIARTLFPNKPIHLVTIGTGFLDRSPNLTIEEASKMGLLEWIPKIILVGLQSREQLTQMQLDILLHDKSSNLIRYNYFNIRIPEEHHNSFNGSVENLRALHRFGKLMVHQNRAELHRLAKTLLEN